MAKKEKVVTAKKKPPKSSGRRLTDKEKIEIMAFHTMGTYNQEELAEKYNVSTNTISSLINRKTHSQGEHTQIITSAENSVSKELVAKNKEYIEVIYEDIYKRDKSLGDLQREVYSAINYKCKNISDDRFTGIDNLVTSYAIIEDKRTKAMEIALKMEAQRLEREKFEFEKQHKQEMLEIERAKLLLKHDGQNNTQQNCGINIVVNGSDFPTDEERNRLENDIQK